jgi:hypothetical protein
MIEDIVKRLKHRLFWSDADEAIAEIELLRKTVSDWEKTAKILALDLGHPEYAAEVYDDIRSGLYDKVRGRMKDSNNKNV